MFKRMYWAGSKARFYGVTWHGSETQIGDVTRNYHVNVRNALFTADQLATFTKTLDGEVTVAAHSLGNMVASSAIHDWNAKINQYCMVDAAVAIEAYDGGATQSLDMVHIEWDGYEERLWASEWFELFEGFDERSTLTWRHRLVNMRTTTVYNFYSAGEDVLRTHPHNDHPDLVDALSGLYAWALQEKTKGRFSTGAVLGSDYGGWGFSNHYSVPRDQTVGITNDELKLNPFFIPGDSRLYQPGSAGSDHAKQKHHQLLAELVPSRTLAAGANPVARFAPANQPNRNFNMNTSFQNGWPQERASQGDFNWYHSDVRAVGYVFIHGLFKKFVEIGGLDQP
jgi:pimeloyl-ACP methyl ester carboxylesterase